MLHAEPGPHGSRWKFCCHLAPLVVLASQIHFLSFRTLHIAWVFGCLASVGGSKIPLWLLHSYVVPSEISPTQRRVPYTQNLDAGRSSLDASSHISTKWDLGVPGSLSANETVTEQRGGWQEGLLDQGGHPHADHLASIDRESPP